MRRKITGIVVLVSLALFVSGCQQLVEQFTRDTPGEANTKREAAIRSKIRRLQNAENASEVGRTVGEWEARARFDRAARPNPDAWPILSEAITRLRKSDPSFDYAYSRGFLTGWRSIGNERFRNYNAEAKLAERDFQEGRPFSLPLPNDPAGPLGRGYRYGWQGAANRASVGGAYMVGGFDPNYKTGGGDGGGDGGGP